eukprot:352123-Chlamydomonas_euryale.AAC.1
MACWLLRLSLQSLRISFSFHFPSHSQFPTLGHEICAEIGREELGLWGGTVLSSTYRTYCWVYETERNQNGPARPERWAVRCYHKSIIYNI